LWVKVFKELELNKNSVWVIILVKRTLIHLESERGKKNGKKLKERERKEIPF
jgi:hypothetical protein